MKRISMSRRFKKKSTLAEDLSVKLKTNSESYINIHITNRIFHAVENVLAWSSCHFVFNIALWFIVSLLSMGLRVVSVSEFLAESFAGKESYDNAEITWSAPN